MRVVFACALAALPGFAHAEGEQAFEDCFNAFANATGYIGYANETGSPVDPQLLAAVNADMLSYARTGVRKFGEERATEIGRRAGEKRTDAVMAKMFGPYQAIEKVAGKARAVRAAVLDVIPCTEDGSQVLSYLRKHQ